MTSVYMPIRDGVLAGLDMTLWPHFIKRVVTRDALKDVRVQIARINYRLSNRRRRRNRSTT